MSETHKMTGKSGSSKALSRYIFKPLLILIIIVLLLPLIVHLGPVQNWLIDRITDKISEQTHSKVDIDHVKLSIFKGLVVEGLYLSEKNNDKDTLIHLGEFSTSLKQNLLSIMDNQLYLRQLRVANGTVNLRKAPGEKQSNLDKFLAHFNTNDSNSQPTPPVSLNLEKIVLDNINVNVENADKAESIYLQLDKGIIDIEFLGLASDSMIISNLLLSNPIVDIQRMKKSGQIKNKPLPDPVDSTVIQNRSDQYLEIHHVELSNGKFKLDDWNKDIVETIVPAIDYSHLDVRNIHMNADSVTLKLPLDVRANIKSLTLNENKGFEIQQLDVKSFHFSDQEIALSNFDLKTEASRLKQDLKFEYDGFADFQEFAQKISINANLDSTRLALSELTYFFPDLAGSSFFRVNKDKWFDISGNIYGTVDDFDADGLALSISDQINLRGSVSARDLTQPNKALINLYVDRMSTSLRNLRQIIPSFNPPPQFYRLGTIRFKGDIDGFFKDFVIYGTLESDLGKVVLDTRLDVKDGINEAKYSGELSLQSFDLQRWTNNPDFGLATLTATIADGRGLTLNNVYTDLTAELKKFDFKGYSYSDVRLEGELEKNQFNGQFTASDPNVDLDFDGQFNISDRAFTSDFEAEIRKIDLRALNLSKDISNINGDLKISLKGNNANDLIGSFDVADLQIEFKEQIYTFDSIYVSSAPGVRGSRNLLVFSDFLNASIDGAFDFAELVPSFNNFIVEHHPEWASKLGMEKKAEELNNAQNFRYKLSIADSKNYLELLNINDLQFFGLELNGSSNLSEDVFNGHVEFDSSSYKNYMFRDFTLDLTQRESVGKYFFRMEEISSESRVYNPIELRTEIAQEQIDLQIITKNVLDSIGNVDISVKISLVGDRIKFNLKDRKLQMFSRKWTVNPDNQLVYGDKYIDLQNFILSDGYRDINIQDYENNGLDISLSNFDFQLINGIINYDKINFTGEGNADVRIEEIFDTPVINGGIYIPEFKLNGVDYGILSINATDVGKNLVNAGISLVRQEDDMSIKVDAEYNKEEETLAGSLKAKNLVMNTFEFIIDEGISNTSGRADINWKISGKMDDLKLRGEAFIKKGRTTIDYLGLDLKLGTERVRVTENFIDLTNVSLYDRFGNRALMLGGLQHNLFADFRSQLNISSERFMALETTKFENPAYYGTGIGDISVDFSGPFNSTDIVVNAVTGPGTTLNIPVEDTYENFDESFITFIDRDQILNPTVDSLLEPPKLEGVDVEMNLTITQDAQVNIIFNERLNDIIRGRGNGDLRIVVSREGEFNIYGDYEVVSGEYLFTAWGIVAKPFEVKRGGQITWTGDPINANLSIEAEYAGLRVPTNVFLAEYLVANEALEQEAKKRTQVDLKMKLRGTLYDPEIGFDIAFPELQGELRTYADSKIRTLRENEADLNEQVAGLIMFRSFLPSNSLGDNLITSGSLAQTSYNTVSEFVSNQLSFLLSGLLQEALSENGFVSGIDFEIGFSKSSNLIEDKVEVDNILPDEIEVHFKPRFQNDKWGFDYGTSFVNSSNSISGITNYVIHDFVIEYYLTDDRRLKLRAYGKWDKDEVEFQNEQKYGVGINYRKEFGSLMDFKQDISQNIEKIRENEQGGVND